MKHDYREELGKAVEHFWRTRGSQQGRQGLETETDGRDAVVGGKHADGFVQLINTIVCDAGLSEFCVHAKQKLRRTLPGYFRPAKEWDLVVVSGTHLVAAVEVKSQVGSFGNNFNNRVEEALGNATDFWTAYREGLFKPSQKPWLGYLFMLEETPVSMRPCRDAILQPFKVDPPFQGRSYAKRYELVCERLLRERLYDATCFFTSNRVTGITGAFSEPNPELSIQSFAVSLRARAAAFAELIDSNSK